jgi:hypothetical protein
MLGCGVLLMGADPIFSEKVPPFDKSHFRFDVYLCYGRSAASINGIAARAY